MTYARQCIGYDGYRCGEWFLAARVTQHRCAYCQHVHNAGWFERNRERVNMKARARRLQHRLQRDTQALHQLLGRLRAAKKIGHQGS